jgi:serine/threonine protein kinase
LFDWVGKRVALGPERSFEAEKHVIRQLLSALHHLHSRGVAHLDVSLENIFLEESRVTERPTVRLADFGVAQQFSAASPFFQIHEVRTWPGKIKYMAPELYAVQPNLDPTALDLWSFGVCLFMMFTGLTAYLKPFDKHYKTLFVRVQSLPSPVNDFVAGFLQVDPTLRRSAQEMLKHPWLQCPSNENR